MGYQSGLVGLIEARTPTQSADRSGSLFYHETLCWELGCTKAHWCASTGSILLGIVSSVSSTRTHGPQHVPHLHTTYLAAGSPKKHCVRRRGSAGTLIFNSTSRKQSRPVKGVQYIHVSPSKGSRKTLRDPHRRDRCHARSCGCRGKFCCTFAGFARHNCLWWELSSIGHPFEMVRDTYWLYLARTVRGS